MAEQSKFGEEEGLERPLAVNCAACEAQIMDALDGILNEKEQAAFDAHLLHCQNCARATADARRGAAWLEILREVPPEPPAALLERILAETSGATAQQAATLGYPQHYANVLPFRRRGGWSVRSAVQSMMQPRLAMTAAMAFFSIALTLNLTGVHPTQWKVSDLKPSNIRRSLYQANAHVVRSFDNLRVVYELESRVRELQRSSDDAGSTDRSRQNNRDDGKSNDQKRPAEEPGSHGKSSRGGTVWREDESNRLLAYDSRQSRPIEEQSGIAAQIQREVRS